MSGRPVPRPRDAFLALSVALTGFRAVELESTGLVDGYLEVVAAIVGDDTTGQLLAAAADVLGTEGGAGQGAELIAAPGAEGGATSEPAAAEQQVARILADPRLGPVARNLIVLWYLGQWDQLPQAWRSRYGASPLDTSRVISAAAYREGLVWPAIGAHPMGAKPTGYASWATRPPDLSVDP